MLRQGDDFQRQPGLIAVQYAMQFSTYGTIQYHDDFVGLYALRTQAFQTGAEPVGMFLCI